MQPSPTDSPSSSDARAGRHAGTVPACLMRGGRMGELMRSLDWTGTRLGAPETWPQSLRTSISICLDCHFPILVWWGPELVMLYNDDYRPMLGGKHPASLGQRGQRMLAGNLAHHRADAATASCPAARRRGPRTCCCCWKATDIRKNVISAFPTARSRTKPAASAASSRRSRRPPKKLSGNGGCAPCAISPPARAGARDFETACRRAADTMAENPFDLPFALLYQIAPEADRARLVATAGIAAGRSASPEEIKLRQDEGGDDLAARRSRADRGGGRRRGSGRRFRDLPSGGWTVPPARGAPDPDRSSRPERARGGPRRRSQSSQASGPGLPGVSRLARGADRRCARRRAEPMRRSAGAPMPSPRSTGRKRPSSRMSATSSARR